MALEGPQLVYARNENEEPALARALRLAQEVEELLEETPSVPDGEGTSGARSTRMVRAMAASLVDELEALARGSRKSRVS
jgi:hypothetical protein